MLATPVFASASQVWQMPKQKSTGKVQSMKFNKGTLSLMAEYDITARILGKKFYNDGKNSEIAPMDLALGWGRMSDPNVYGSLRIWQSKRWYFYRWSNGPPIPAQEIVRSSANVHIIPANNDIAKRLAYLKKDQIVNLKGYLVYYKESSGWNWRSSLTRSDSGDGACELMFVTSVQGY